MRLDTGRSPRIAATTRHVRLACVALLAAAGGALCAAEPPPNAGSVVLHELRNFATTGRVLHIAAHPDDENTQLLAYLSRGRGYDTAYLSITRGDGGQNLLGPRLDEKLGVARTQELLAARRIDGGRQFFTRAIDFGFSKNPDETLSIWNHQAVLSDVVRVIRLFRPDVIITRFPIPPGSGGHGHHTASAILAVEAFKLAGDPGAFPEQLRQGLAPWQPKRILWNIFSFGGRGPGPLQGPTVQMDIGGDDPVTKEPFGTIANRSRGMHKTQGLGGFADRTSNGPNIQTFMLLGGEPAEKDIMDGVDTTWNRVPGGGEIGRLADAAMAEFRPDNPATSLPALLAIRKQLATLPPDPLVADKRTRLDDIVRRCLGLELKSRTALPTIVPGETVPVTASARVLAPVPVTWVAVEQFGTRTRVGESLHPAAAVSRSLKYTLPKDTPVTQPYWLREPSSVGMYHVSDPKLIGLPENPPAVSLTCVFQVDGQQLAVADQLTAADEEEVPEAVVVVPKVSLRFEGGAAIFRPGATAAVQVDVIAGRPAVAGTVRLDAPAGWRASSPQAFRIAEQSGRVRLTFQVTAPAAPAVGVLGVRAVVDGVEWTNDSIEIQYPHIPRQLLQPPARKKLVSVDVATRGGTIGYVPGAGDDIPDALTQLGYRVVTLNGADLVPDKLKGLDAVVMGVRAFNTRTDLAPNLPALFSYVENGGTVVCQYNWARDLKVEQIAPYRLRLSQSRVTDENAAVTFLAPEHPVMNRPNRITAVDFEGWVQERGIYFPSEWDEHFVPILAMNDPGEPPLKGALLVADHGKGRFVYTSLVFFRELPAGVPGAYRLFANLVSPREP